MSEILNVKDDLELRRRFLFRVCETKQELHDWVLTFIGLDLPDCIVDPDSNSSPMDMVYEMYTKMREGTDEEFMRVLYYASRDSFKTLGAAVIEVLAMLHLNRNVAHMAAIQDQALKAQEYVKRAFRRPYIRDFVEGDNERITKIVRFYNPETQHSLTRSEYEALSLSEQAKHEEVARVLGAYLEREQYIKIVICTMAGANSEHVPLFVIDEVDVVANPAAYEEAQNIPAGRGGKLPITMLTSTRKSSFGLVQKEIDRAKKSGLQIRHWNIIDVTEACPPARHRPDLPKLKLYSSDDELRHVDEAGYAAMNFKERETFAEREAFAGCRTCKLFAACKTRLATHQKSTSLMLKSIPETIGKFNANSLEMAKAQLLCWKPSSTGLIYGRFDRTRHVLTPAMAYAKIFGEAPPDPKNFTKALLVRAVQERQVEWRAGIDWGHTHNFSYVNGFKDGARFFVTHCVSIPGLDPEQMLTVSEPFLEYEPATYADTADPKMTALFRKKGHRMMKWKKGKVVGGINIVRWKLNPPMGEPELFFVVDIDEDHGMHLLIQHLAEYHWTTDAAGKPTDIPDEDGDDEPDALRYLVENTFSPKGQVSVSTDAEPSAIAARPEGQYQGNNWLQQRIAELTGAPVPEPTVQAPPRRMVVEVPTASGYRSYYADDPAPKKAPREEAPEAGTPTRGRKGRLSWDLG